MANVPCCQVCCVVNENKKESGGFVDVFCGKEKVTTDERVALKSIAIASHATAVPVACNITISIVVSTDSAFPSLLPCFIHSDLTSTRPI